MISKEELKDYAKKVNLNLGNAEKDYFLNILLLVIYRNYGNELIFKGGTALKKCYGLDRFSEDLDFTCKDNIDIKKIENGLKDFKLEYEIETKNFPTGLKVTLRIKGPLFTGIRNSMCKIILDFSFRENIILSPKIKTIGRFLEEIPAFDVFVMDEREILAEKIRTIMSRDKARDIYDLWFLIRSDVKVDLKLIDEKLKYYNTSFNLSEFKSKLNIKEAIWISELSLLINNVPDWKEVKNRLIKTLSEIGGQRFNE